MIDIHCHILPGLDDGPRAIESSVKMARQAHEDGIQTIVAAPHIHSFDLTPDRINHACNQLQNRLTAEKIPLRLIPGGEVNAFYFPNEVSHYTIGSTPFILLEFPHSHWPAQASQILFNMTSSGFYPIIVHPERNPGIVHNPKLLIELLNDNVKVQITAGSLLGQFGEKSSACARYLLKKGVVHFLATDAHDPDYRQPILSKGLKAAAKVIGKKEASKLVEDNPAAILTAKC